MGVGSAKRPSAKLEHTPVRARRSVSRSIKAESCTPTPRSSHSKSAQREGSFSSRLPTDQQRRNNGRVTGRSLIVWGRPRMAEKLLLHMQYECARHRSQMPWDAIAHRLHPGSSGAAVIQHLGRLRRELIAEGHLVPPMACRPGVKDTQDPEIRGFMREDSGGTDQDTVRPVRFDEYVEDRKVNLPASFDDEEEHSDGDGPAFYPSDAEGEASFPESPTPMGRRYRTVAPTRRPAIMPARLEPEAESMYPLPPGVNATRADSMPIDQALIEHEPSMYASPDTASTRDSGAEEHGASAGHESFGGHPMLPQMAPQRPPVSSERNYHAHPGHAFGDSFDGYGHPSAGMPMSRMPMDYYHPLQYGFNPWPMGFPMNPNVCFPPYPQERMTERAVNEVPGSGGGSDTDVQPKVEPSQEPSQAETQSSNGTQSSEAQHDDPINEHASGAVDSTTTVDSAGTSQA